MDQPYLPPKWWSINPRGVAKPVPIGETPQGNRLALSFIGQKNISSSSLHPGQSYLSLLHGSTFGEAYLVKEALGVCYWKVFVLGLQVARINHVANMLGAEIDKLRDHAAPQPLVHITHTWGGLDTDRTRFPGEFLGTFNAIVCFKQLSPNIPLHHPTLEFCPISNGPNEVGSAELISAPYNSLWWSLKVAHDDFATMIEIYQSLMMTVTTVQ